MLHTELATQQWLGTALSFDKSSSFAFSLPSYIYEAQTLYITGGVVLSCLKRYRVQARGKSSQQIMAEEEQRSLEDTPTWAVSVCCFFFVIISLMIGGGLHKLTEVIINILQTCNCVFMNHICAVTYSIMNRDLK